MKIDLWIEGYSNCGTKIKTAFLKQAVQRFQDKYPERNYKLVRHNGLWFIAEGEAK